MAEGAPASGFYRWSAAELADHLQQQPVDSPETAAALMERLGETRAGPPWAPDSVSSVGSSVAAACGRVARAASDGGDPDFSIARLFEAVGRWALAALAADDSSTDEPWPQSDSDPRSRSFSAAQCRGVLANLLLLNVDDPVGRVAGLKPAHKGGGLRLDRDMLLDDEVGMHKLCCLLQYFATAMRLEGSADDSREVIFERRTSRGSDLGDFKAQVLAAPHLQAGLPRVTLHSAGMEAPAADVS